MPTISAAFAARVRATPDAIALMTGTHRASYAALDARATELAARMAARGVAAGGRVALALDRSIDTACAMLAAWRLGAAILPVDPAWPAARRAEVTGGAPLIDGAALAAGTASPPGPESPSPAALALVLATSGSTGRPKRVHLSHGALAHRLDALARALPFQGDDVCVCRTPPTFIDAFAELFGPLVAGVPSWMLPHPLAIADLARALHDARITRLVIVPSLLAVLLDACPDLGATALRVVITSGEPLGPELAARFFAAAPGVRLVNVYGSTEVAGDATLGDVRGGRVTIGRALAGVTVRIVDEAGHAVRDGEVGELVVSGPVLADGYDDPTLTAARFVRDPDTGDRVFRTGDRGRLVDGGELVLVGARRRPGQDRGRARRARRGRARAPRRRGRSRRGGGRR